MAYYTHDSVPSGRLNLPQNQNADIFDAANAGLSVFEGLLRHSKARRTEQENTGFQLLQSHITDGESKVKNLEAELGFKDPIVIQKRQQLEDLKMTLNQELAEVASGRKRKGDVIRSPNVNSKLQMFLTPIGAEAEQRRVDTLEGQRQEKQSQKLYNAQRQVLGEPDARQKEQARTVLSGGASMSEMPQFIQRGAANPLLPNQNNPIGLEQVLGKQTDQTRLDRARQIGIDVPKVANQEQRAPYTIEATHARAKENGLQEGEYTTFKKANGDFDYRVNPSAYTDSFANSLASLIKEGKYPGVNEEAYENFKAFIFSGKAKSLKGLSYNESKDLVKRALKSLNVKGNPPESFYAKVIAGLGKEGKKGKEKSDALSDAESVT